MLLGPRIILRTFISTGLEPYSGYRSDLEVEFLSGYDRPYPRSTDELKARIDARQRTPSCTRWPTFRACRVIKGQAPQGHTAERTIREHRGGGILMRDWQARHGDAPPSATT